MDINGGRVLMAGATGVLGRALTTELIGRGARPALAGRDLRRLAAVARDHPGVPTVVFDAYDTASCARAAPHRCRDGGLDAVVTVFGSVAFGRAEAVGDEVAEHLMTVNFLAPAAFFRAALGVLSPGSVIAAVAGVVAERPQPAMADYSASKAALSAWLAAVRREAQGAGVRVLDIRPDHLHTGFAEPWPEPPRRCAGEAIRVRSPAPSWTPWRRTPNWCARCRTEPWSSDGGPGEPTFPEP